MRIQDTNEAELTTDSTRRWSKKVPYFARTGGKFVFMTHSELGAGIVFWYKSKRIRNSCALMRGGGFFAPAIPGGTNNRENHQ